MGATARLTRSCRRLGVSIAMRRTDAAHWSQTLARPGGIITGVFLSGSSSKRLELLKEVRPRATTFGFLQNAADPANPLIKKKDMDNAARILGIKLEIVEVKDRSELADASYRMEARGVAGVAT